MDVDERQEEPYDSTGWSEWERREKSSPDPSDSEGWCRHYNISLGVSDNVVCLKENTSLASTTAAAPRYNLDRIVITTSGTAQEWVVG